MKHAGVTTRNVIGNELLIGLNNDVLGNHLRKDKTEKKVFKNQTHEKILVARHCEIIELENNEFNVRLQKRSKISTSIWNFKIQAMQYSIA